MSDIILTTGVYDLIKDHLRRKQTTQEEEVILLDQLKKAQQVLRKNLAADVVTVNCAIRIKDLSTNQEEKYVLVPSNLEKVKKGKYSILSPMGLATVGNKVGDIIDWPFHNGEKKFEILRVEHLN